MVNQHQKQFKILLIGDSCLDVYVLSTVERISPEAPVPVCKMIESFELPGMAANVKENLEKLNVDVEFLSGCLGTKTRIIDKRSNQHMIRIDDDVTSDILDITNISYEGFDAVVISDYDKGLLDYDTICTIISDCRSLDLPVFVDTKKRDLEKFEGAYIKINEFELKNSISNSSKLIVTHGGNSVIYKNKEFKVPKTDIVDVCGAGDTFLAALVYKFLDTKSIDVAIKFAICAAGKTVQKMGVYAPKLEEIV